MCWVPRDWNNPGEHFCGLPKGHRSMHECDPFDGPRWRLSEEEKAALPKLEEPPKFDRTPIPVGRHVLTLEEVKDHEAPNPFESPVMNEELGEMVQPIRREWIWKFRSDKLDPKTKKGYEFAVFTPRFYSATSSTNKLSLLMRQLAPEQTDAERTALIETDGLVGRRWNARLIEATSKNGKKFITYNSFEPIEEDYPNGTFDPEAVAKAAGETIPF